VAWTYWRGGEAMQEWRIGLSLQCGNETYQSRSGVYHQNLLVKINIGWQIVQTLHSPSVRCHFFRMDNTQRVISCLFQHLILLPAAPTCFFSFKATKFWLKQWVNNCLYFLPQDIYKLKAITLRKGKFICRARFVLKVIQSALQLHKTRRRQIKSFHKYKR